VSGETEIKSNELIQRNLNMSVSLTHSASSLARARPSSASSSASSSWLAKLVVVLASVPEIFAEAREEERKAHARYPFIAW